MGYGEREYGTGSYKYGDDSPIVISNVVVVDVDNDAPDEGIDLKIDLDTNDIVISQGDLSFASGARLVMQDLQCNTMLFYGECFLNTSLGIKYLTDICVKSPNLSHVKALIKESILKTWKVKKLVSFTFDYDARTRHLSVKFLADTAFGIVSKSVVM
jgi:hypothetical protein